MRDSPTAAVLAAQAPALLQSFDLSGGRAVALIRAAREVAGGRVDLHAPDHERAWRRLRAIRGIGSWTVQMLALTGQGRFDQLPCGRRGVPEARRATARRHRPELEARGAAGRVRGRGSVRRATEDEVVEFFAPYAPWAGLAGLHALRLGGGSAAARVAA